MIAQATKVETYEAGVQAWARNPMPVPTMRPDKRTPEIDAELRMLNASVETGAAAITTEMKRQAELEKGLDVIILDAARGEEADRLSAAIETTKKRLVKLNQNQTQHKADIRRLLSEKATIEAAREQLAGAAKLSSA